MNDLIGQTVDFTYTDKSGKVSERSGEVIPNHKNIDDQKFVTIRQSDGQARCFDLSRIHVAVLTH